jgi:hypothetical protein
MLDTAGIRLMIKQHIWGPIGSVLVHVVIVTMLLMFAVAPPPLAPPEVEVGIMETKADVLEEVLKTEIEKVETPPVREEITVERPDVTVATVSTMDVPSDAPGTGGLGNSDGAGIGSGDPSMAAGFEIAMAKSPLVMRGLYSNRTAGGRKGALSAFGGSQRGEEAVMRALRWLKKYQEADGSWLPTAGGPIPDPGGEKYKGNPEAFTGLALLAFLAHGDTPASREFGETVEKAMRWLVAHQKSDGSWNNKSGDLGYSHAIATYAICEAFGMTKIMALKDSAEKGIVYLLKQQAPNGGWNYLGLNPVARQDVSMIAWCVQALKAAKIAGVGNLTEIDGALKKAVGCLSTVLYTGTGVFNYDVNEKGEAKVVFPHVSCAAVLALQIAGAGKGAVCQGGLKWLRANASCNWKEPWGTNPFYYWYYTTQVMFQAGDQAWKEWNPRFATEAIRNQVVEKNAIQGPDGTLVDIGYWKPLHEKEYCQAFIYNTTMCVLQLEVYYRYLPTYKQVEAGHDPATPAKSADDVVVDVL